MVFCRRLQRICFPFLCVVSLLLTACSSPVVTAAVSDTSIRSEIKNLYSGVTWSDELSPEGLPKPEQKKVSIPLPSSLVPLDQASRPVFPVLKDFGSLNSSQMPSELKKLLDSFFDSVSEMQRRLKAQPAAVSSAGPNAEIREPDEGQAERSAAELQTDARTSADINTKIPPPEAALPSLKEFVNPARSFLPIILNYTLESLPVTERVLYGEIFRLADSYEIPVRLYGSETRTDCVVFAVRKEDSSFVIDQIQFGETVGNAVFPD